MSDPQGDVLRQMMDPLPNPILEAARQSMLRFWMPYDSGESGVVDSSHT